MEHISFYSKSKNGKCLSNFANLNVELDKKYFISGEHAFHGMKYLKLSEYTDDDSRKQLFLDHAKKFEGKNPFYYSSLDAKKGGGKRISKK